MTASMHQTLPEPTNNVDHPALESGRIVDIVMGFDSNYAAHAASTIASIVRWTRSEDIRFLVLHPGMERNLQAQVESVAPRARFEWIVVGEDMVPELGERGHISRATLYRLGLETLAPADCRRLLYLDSDLIVLDDVRKLWAQDLGGFPIGAVQDRGVDNATFAATWGLPPEGAYFNAGVLLIDLEQVRANRLLSRALEIQIKQGADLPYNDQDALNLVFWTQWRHLDSSWNFQRNMLIPETEIEKRYPARARDSAVRIVHFTTFQKPWLKRGWHPWSWLYWDNLARTPFLKEVARKEGVSFWNRLRARLRWLKRRPNARALSRRT